MLSLRGPAQVLLLGRSEGLVALLLRGTGWGHEYVWPTIHFQVVMRRSVVVLRYRQQIDQSHGTLHLIAVHIKRSRYQSAGFIPNDRFRPDTVLGVGLGLVVSQISCQLRGVCNG